MDSTGTVLRVERGQAAGEELAALAVVLLVLRSRCRNEPESPSKLGWKWWKQARAYAAPGSWR